jgi:hypothetical protein
MKIRSSKHVLLRLPLVVLGASFGWLLFCGARWIVYHDSINYRLPDYGLRIISNAAEIVFTIGSVSWVVTGFFLALPLLLVSSGT